LEDGLTVGQRWEVERVVIEFGEEGEQDGGEDLRLVGLFGIKPGCAMHDDWKIKSG
jgi:hypothetical protein